MEKWEANYGHDLLYFGAIAQVTHGYVHGDNVHFIFISRLYVGGFLQ